MTTGTFTADANGTAGLAICPSVLQRTVLSSPTYTAGIIQTWADVQNSSISASVTTDEVQRQRVTGATLKIEYIGDDFHNSGEFALKMYTHTHNVQQDWTSGTFDAYPKSFTAFCQRQKFTRARDSQFITFTPANELSRRQFETIGSVGQNTPQGLKSIVLLLSGANPTDRQSWRYTLVQNVEFIWEPNTVLARSSTLAPPRDASFVEKYSRTAAAMLRRGYDIIPLSFKQRMMQSLAGAAATYLGGPGAGTLAIGYMEVD
jgi:hypothetical protein